MEYIAKCPHCGSTNLGEVASDLYRYHPTRFTKDENGVVKASDYGRAAEFIDNGSLVSDPYDCLDCGAIDMALTDLVLDEVEPDSVHTENIDITEEG